jgi:predicted esterase
LLWAGGLPQEIWTDSARARLAETELVLAAGDADPYVPSQELAGTVEKAQAFGYRVRAFGFAGGHAITSETLAQAIASQR